MREKKLKKVLFCKLIISKFRIKLQIYEIIIITNQKYYTLCRVL